MSVRRSAGRALCGATLVCLTACGSTASDVPTPVIIDDTTVQLPAR